MRPERLHSHSLRYVVGISALFGLTFGLLDVAWPAFARTHGSIAAAGLFLSLFGVGAGAGGLLYPVQVAAVDEVSPEAHRAEAFTWVGTVYGVGSALGAALAGQLIVQSGDRAALIAAAGATAAAWLLATLLQARPGLPHA